jgi:hypothetical protein
MLAVLCLTLHMIFLQDPETVFPLFRVSYHWIAPMGLLATLTVGSLVGWLFDKKEDIRMDEELFTPAVWRLLPAEAHVRAGEARLAAAAVLSRSHSPVTGAPLIIARHDKVCYSVFLAQIPLLGRLIVALD